MWAGGECRKGIVRTLISYNHCAGDIILLEILFWGYHTTRIIILGISYYSKYHAGDIILLEISCWGYNTTLCTDIIQPPGQLNHVSCITRVFAYVDRNAILHWELWMMDIMQAGLSYDLGYHEKVYRYDTITVLRITQIMVIVLCINLCSIHRKISTRYHTTWDINISYILPIYEF